MLLTTLLFIASFLLHPPQTHYAPTLLIYFKFLKYPLLVYIRLWIFMLFPLPNKLLVTLKLQGQTPPQPVHCPKLDVNTSNAVTPFLTSIPPQQYIVYTHYYYSIAFMVHYSTE